MRIGYACLCIGVPNTNMKSCMIKNAEEFKLLELISNNLNSLENIIDYNIKNNIKLFRISSDLIPFGSSSVNRLPWWDIYAAKFLEIGNKIKNSGMRISMHPGQYTVINSPNEEVVRRAIYDLNYHAKVLECLGVGADNKIILHIGGIYNDKKSAINRFISNFCGIDDWVRNRIVLENDDKSFNICDVLEIGTILNVPVVFDNLHNEINSCDRNKSDIFWINECRKTWKEKDGSQKIHYSQQDSRKKPGSHSNSILVNKFMDFYYGMERDDIDIMLEVKDKNLSAVKCINCTSSDKRIKALELEWSKYKYSILERSIPNYVEIQKLLDNNGYNAIMFYNLIEDSLQKQSTTTNSINVAQHLWSYFNSVATDKEEKAFLKNIEMYDKGKGSIKTIKNILWRMAVKYQTQNLINSYYFLL